MIISHIALKNWRNFRDVNVDLGNRVFLVGPNASGKSNFLDAIRFLRDIAKPGGGLQKSVLERGGLSKIRCLAARQHPGIEIEVELSDFSRRETVWKYSIGIRRQERGLHLPSIKYERVSKNGRIILERPEPKDKEDIERLTQTYLEQINANADFRDIARFFESITYLHMIPQLLQHPDAFAGYNAPGDPYGRFLLETIALTPKTTQLSRLSKIEGALRIAVPQLSHLALNRDEVGIPHLEAKYAHWRPDGAYQKEDQFSDGTLRLISLLWALLDGDSLLLFEEPELSLNSGIIMQLPSLMYKLQQQKKRQIILSTHSADLLLDKGIAGEDVLVLKPSPEGTTVEKASSIYEISNLLESGFSVGEAVMPHIKPPNPQQLTFQFIKL